MVAGVGRILHPGRGGVGASGGGGFASVGGGLGRNPRVPLTYGPGQVRNWRMERVVLRQSCLMSTILTSWKTEWSLEGQDRLL